MRYLFLALAALLFLADGSADARGRMRVRYRETVRWSGGGAGCQANAPQPEAAATIEASADDALAEVNAARAARGLRPFLKDNGLTRAAEGAARYRAAHGLAGHTSNDVAFLPPGSSAPAAGCAAWRVGEGWGSCCTYEGWTYAGAAVVVRDGVRFMHLFVRD